MNKEDIYIGVDLGGTKIISGAIDSQGKLLTEPVKILTEGKDTAEHIIARLCSTIDQTISQIDQAGYGIAGIGIGATGPLDFDKGIILECPQLTSLHYFPLKSTIEEKYGLSVRVSNDANCLIYGEALYGKAKSASNVLGFTLGTGLGCAIVMNGKIHNGSRHAAGEIWPSPYLGDGVEMVASSIGIAKMFYSKTGRDIPVIEIAELAYKGDDAAVQTWKEYGAHLAVPIAWGVNFIDPEVIILGGSIAKSYSLFEGTLKEGLEKYICPSQDRFPRIELASLGDNAGFVGAASLHLH